MAFTWGQFSVMQCSICIGSQITIWTNADPNMYVCVCVCHQVKKREKFKLIINIVVCLIYTERSVNHLFQSAGIINSTTNLNSSLHGQNGCHFADDIFKFIFINEKFCILICISLFVHKGPIDNKSALVRVIGDKPLPEPMLTQFTDAYMQH